MAYEEKEEYGVGCGRNIAPIACVLTWSVLLCCRAGATKLLQSLLGVAGEKRLRWRFGLCALLGENMQQQALSSPLQPLSTSQFLIPAATFFLPTRLFRATLPQESRRIQSSQHKQPPPIEASDLLLLLSSLVSSRACYVNRNAVAHVRNCMFMLRWMLVLWLLALWL